MGWGVGVGDRGQGFCCEKVKQHAMGMYSGPPCVALPDVFYLACLSPLMLLYLLTIGCSAATTTVSSHIPTHQGLYLQSPDPCKREGAASSAYCTHTAPPMDFSAFAATWQHHSKPSFLPPPPPTHPPTHSPFSHCWSGVCRWWPATSIPGCCSGMSRTHSRRCWQTRLVPCAAVWCVLYCKKHPYTHRYPTVSCLHLLCLRPSLLHLICFVMPHLTSICQSVCFYVNLPVCLSVCSFVCLSDRYMSICWNCVLTVQLVLYEDLAARLPRGQHALPRQTVKRRYRDIAWTVLLT